MLLRRQINCAIRKAKCTYAQRIKQHLESNKPTTAWSGLKTLLNMRNETTKAVAQCDADELKKFYSRFETAATVAPPGNLDGMVRGVDKGMSFTANVEPPLKAINTKKTPGPDGIHPPTLTENRSNITSRTLTPALHELYYRANCIQYLEAE